MSVSSYLQWRINGFLDLFQTEQEIKERYEFQFWQKVKKEQRTPEDYGRIINENFSIPFHHFRDKIIVDIGSGPFDTLKRFHDAKELYCIDPLADKYNRLMKIKRDSLLIKGFVENIPIPDNYTDFVFCLNALDHCDNFILGVRNIHRILKKDGIFCLIVEINHKPKVCEPVYIPLHWERFFTKFDIIDFTYYNSLKKGIYQSIFNDNLVTDVFLDEFKPYVLVALMRKK